MESRLRLRTVVLGFALFGAGGCNQGAETADAGSLSDGGGSRRDASGHDDAAREACSTGVPCVPPGQPCRQGTISCESGAPLCKGDVKLADGTECGTHKVCGDGECKPCAPGGACVPDGNACHVGVLSCATGSAVCDRTGDAPDGTTCGKGEVCLAGACSPCAPGAACTKAGHECQRGTLSCASSEATCTVASDVADGTSCEAGLCCGGLCAACSPPPANGTSVCSESTCAFSCSAGLVACDGACVDVTSDPLACGPSCKVCPTGSICSGSECVPPTVFGDSTPFSPCVDGAIEPGYLLGERLFIDSNITVTALGLVASSAVPPSNVLAVLGLYDEVSGVPSTRVAFTAATPIAAGDNVIPVASSSNLEAGYYWILGGFDATAPICEDEITSNATVFVQTGFGPPPATIAQLIPATGADINYYVLGSLSTQ